MYSWNFSTYHFWILCIRYIKPLPTSTLPSAIVRLLLFLYCIDFVSKKKNDIYMKISPNIHLYIDLTIEEW